MADGFRYLKEVVMFGCVFCSLVFLSLLFIALILQKRIHECEEHLFRKKVTKKIVVKNRSALNDIAWRLPLFVEVWWPLTPKGGIKAVAS